mmetsp:Transcript_26765/g.61608  ORF Transcript_26765/g.61608 Transcript_26765/m.61608 type:complete len:88 (-) Transcript_26765:285-548(-)
MHVGKMESIFWTSDTNNVCFWTMESIFQSSDTASNQFSDTIKTLLFLVQHVFLEYVLTTLFTSNMFHAIRAVCNNLLHFPSLTISKL